MGAICVLNILFYPQMSITFVSLNELSVIQNNIAKKSRFRHKNERNRGGNKKSSKLSYKVHCTCYNYSIMPTHI